MAKAVTGPANAGAAYCGDDEARRIALRCAGVPEQFVEVAALQVRLAFH